MLHKNITLGDQHFIQQWEPANAAARTALVVTATDVGKVARQLDTNVFYLLMDDSPMTWADISTAGGAGTVTSVTSANADATVATTTTTPVITIVQAPALRSATTTVSVSAAAAPTSGQVLTATSGTTATWQTPAAGGGGITLGTPVTLTTQTSVDFTSVPTGTKRITIMFSAVSTNGTSRPQIQIGDSGGVESTDYVSEAHFIGGATFGEANATTGFIVNSTVASNVLSGTFFLTLLDPSTNLWSYFGNAGGGGGQFFCSGKKSLSTVLDRVRLTTVNGTDQFDAGQINISYE